MTAQGGMLFLQFTFIFQIFGKRFPLFGSFIAVILRQLFVWFALTHFLMVLQHNYVLREVL